MGSGSQEYAEGFESLSAEALAALIPRGGQPPVRSALLLRCLVWVDGAVEAIMRDDALAAAGAAGSFRVFARRVVLDRFKNLRRRRYERRLDRSTDAATTRPKPNGRKPSPGCGRRSRSSTRASSACGSGWPLG